MQCVTYLCVLIFIAVLVNFTDARKTFSTRRKSGGNNSRRSSSTSANPKQPAPAVTPHKSDSTNTNFLNSERAGSSHSTVNTHHRDPFKNNQDTLKQTVPQTNGPIGFEKLGNQGNQKLGFDKVNSEVPHKPVGSNVPSAPAYPAGSPPYPGGPAKPLANAPNGAPPAYPGYGTGSQSGGFEAPPAYPGRPVNAPPVYSANNPNYGQMNPAQSGFGSNSYQQSNYPHHQSYPGQQNIGYPNTGANFGNHPNQGYNQGFGSYPNGGYSNNQFGSHGQSYPGFGGNSYGGSPFGQSNPYGGSPFSSSGFGGNSFGGYGHNNPHYSPNNFGYSSNPGIFGSSGQYSNYGYHKKSRFGGLPIPIPIPIPIPMGMFGGFGGGHSYNHRLLDTFVKNKNISSAENTTTSVFILNNSTVTPCTTDQFIYDSLNVTLVSCTADNCTAVKMFTTTNVSGEISVNSAALTMCLEPNATYSSHAENVNPIVSDVHKYLMKLCQEVTVVNLTSNITDQPGNRIMKVSETPTNGADNNESNPTTTTSAVVSTTLTDTATSTDSNSTSSSFGFNNSKNSSVCETLECSWMQMCLPSIEIVNSCSSTNCPFTKTAYQPCIRIKMCKSPSTPISTLATLNTTISRIDQSNNATTVNDVANLTLISYTPPSLPVNCSSNATDPNCAPSLESLPKEVCAPSNPTEGSNGDASSTTPSTPICTTSIVPDEPKSSAVDAPTTEVPSTTPIR